MHVRTSLKPCFNFPMLYSQPRSNDDHPDQQSLDKCLTIQGIGGSNTSNSTRSSGSSKKLSGKHNDQTGSSNSSDKQPPQHALHGHHAHGNGRHRLKEHLRRGGGGGAGKLHVGGGNATSVVAAASAAAQRFVGPSLPPALSSSSYERSKLLPTLIPIPVPLTSSVPEFHMHVAVPPVQQQLVSTGMEYGHHHGSLHSIPSHNNNNINTSPFSGIGMQMLMPTAAASERFSVSNSSSHHGSPPIANGHHHHYHHTHTHPPSSSSSISPHASNSAGVSPLVPSYAGPGGCYQLSPLSCNGSNALALSLSHAQLQQQHNSQQASQHHHHQLVQQSRGSGGGGGGGGVGGGGRGRGNRHKQLLRRATLRLVSWPQWYRCQ